MADAIITSEVTSLIDKFKALLDTKDDLAEQTKKNNVEVIECRDALERMTGNAE